MSNESINTVKVDGHLDLFRRKYPLHDFSDVWAAFTPILAETIDSVLAPRFLLSDKVMVLSFIDIPMYAIEWIWHLSVDIIPCFCLLLLITRLSLVNKVSRWNYISRSDYPKIISILTHLKNYVKMHLEGFQVYVPGNQHSILTRAFKNIWARLRLRPIPRLVWNFILMEYISNFSAMDSWTIPILTQTHDHGRNR